MKKFFSAALAATLALTLATAAAADSVTLSDVQPEQWFYEPVNRMISAGYIDGYEDATFRPGRDVSVVEFVTMAAKVFGVETGEEYGHWGGKQMAEAYDLGWLSELDCRWTDFNEPVSRQLAAKILAVALDLKASDEIPYSDAADVGQSYVTYVGAMCAAGLLDGYEDGTIRPGRVLTRAEAATLIFRAAEESGNIITAAPDGTPFVTTIDLSSYDNPNFSVKIKDGVAVVDLKYAELWTDVADPNSPNAEEAAEGKRREEVTEAMSHTRIIPLEGVTAAYELPCTSWFPGADCWAIIATADGHWYRVDLSGQYDHGRPQAKELTALHGADSAALFWCTTTGQDGDTTYMGQDYIVARPLGGTEVLAYGD